MRYEHCHGPVSYTHLDVYKRQVPFLISTVAGSIVAAIVMLILKKNGALAAFKGNL